MDHKLLIKNFLFTAIILSYSNFAVARISRVELEDKIEAIENKLQSNLNLEICGKVDFLQKEVQELRGILEEQQHQLSEISRKLSLEMSSIKDNLIKDEPKSQALNADQAKYNLAYKMIEEKNFSQAIIEFKDFLIKYPDSKYIPNSMYWLGELYLNENNLPEAENYFLEIIDKYKDHNKAPDALLKLGMLERDRNNLDKSKEYFQKITKNYSNSNGARVARTTLSDLDKNQP